MKKVIGIELSQEAVEDAKVNAQLNGRPAGSCPLPRRTVLIH